MSLDSIDRQITQLNEARKLASGQEATRISRDLHVLKMARKEYSGSLDLSPPRRRTSSGLAAASTASSASPPTAVSTAPAVAPVLPSSAALSPPPSSPLRASLMKRSSEHIAADAELKSLTKAFVGLRVESRAQSLRSSRRSRHPEPAPDAPVAGEVERRLEEIARELPYAKDKREAHKSGFEAAQSAYLDPFMSFPLDPDLPKHISDGMRAPENTTGIVHDRDGRMGLHRNPHDTAHPECPGRLLSIMEAVRASGLIHKCADVPGRMATAEDILAVHPQEHLDFVEQLRDVGTREERSKAMSSDSVYANEHTVDAAYLSCGASLALTDAIMGGTRRVKNGMVVARPPGHHAEPCACMGFCIFNNVAVAAARAKKLGGDGTRVLIVDWDVHHGNGTQRIFLNDPDVMYVSLHRFDNGNFYPATDDGSPDVVGGEGEGGEGASCGAGKGAGKGAGPANPSAKGTNINIGWNKSRRGGAGIGDADYMAAFQHVVMPAARMFDPDIVYVSAGFDAARGDPLGGCDVTPACYAHMTHSLCSLADGKVVVVLEGGYNLKSIAKSAVACLHVLAGGSPPALGGEYGSTSGATGSRKKKGGVLVNTNVDKASSVHGVADIGKEDQEGRRQKRPRSAESFMVPTKMGMEAIAATIQAHRNRARSPWAMVCPIVGGDQDSEEIVSTEKALAEEEDEQERIMRGEREETAEELGKKIAMRALFARMKGRRARAKAEKESKRGAQAGELNNNAAKK